MTSTLSSSSRSSKRSSLIRITLSFWLFFTERISLSSCIKFAWVCWVSCRFFSGFSSLGFNNSSKLLLDVENGSISSGYEATFYVLLILLMEYVKFLLIWLLGVRLKSFERSFLMFCRIEPYVAPLISISDTFDIDNLKGDFLLCYLEELFDFTLLYVTRRDLWGDCFLYLLMTKVLSL